ncbi:FKBP-type peptidyl-prolyl cis-trans isomerase [Aliifodinibius halophilus]|uniref:Peptidyl-prolyl cis-trans isomerase n=2 Tax=Fodinibius halophilus TaxID=1736908 RepID=A0A6M1T1Y9_9BACT|nr:FKBP-type peptidyl-prolyl cis-trans isomerase [Fodinibius halophilus]
MKLTIKTFCLFLAGSFLFVGCNSNSGSYGDVSLEAQIDSVSYSMGYQMGAMSLKPQGMTDVKPELLAAGIKAALEDTSAQLSNREMQRLVRQYQMQAQQKMQQKRMKKGKENAKKGEEFLKKNKEKEGVKVTDSGLQYKVLKEGSGPSPDSTDKVKVHYEGTLLDGEVFDSSYERDNPATFPLNKVIAGWTEGVQLMKEGAKYKFFVPGELAYGNQPPQGGPIGANETLIFEVELLEVNPEE